MDGYRGKGPLKCAVRVARIPVVLVIGTSQGDWREMIAFRRSRLILLLDENRLCIVYSSARFAFVYITVICITAKFQETSKVNWK